MTERYPMTVEQRRLLQQDIAEIQEKLNDMFSLLGACYGDKADSTIRAGEAAAAVQRLEWAVGREMGQPSPSEKA
jgi:hypothetical protein